MEQFGCASCDSLADDGSLNYWRAASIEGRAFNWLFLCFTLCIHTLEAETQPDSALSPKRLYGMMHTKIMQKDGNGLRPALQMRRTGNSCHLSVYVALEKTVYSCLLIINCRTVVIDLGNFFQVRWLCSCDPEEMFARQFSRWSFFFFSFWSRWHGEKSHEEKKWLSDKVGRLVEAVQVYFDSLIQQEDRNPGRACIKWAILTENLNMDFICRS